MKLKKIFRMLLSMPKTVLFNFRYLPLEQAVKLPICFHYGTKIEMKGNGRGCVRFNGPIHFGMVQYGFNTVHVCDCTKTLFQIDKGGKICFGGKALIGRGSKFHVGGKGELTLGDNFIISAQSTINCYKSISFGDDIQFGWDCLVMDSDTHSIYDKDGSVMNPDKPIVFGNKVWIACKATIFKGSVIPDNCVIGAGTLITGQSFTPNTVIAGTPPRSIKEIGQWSI